MRGLDTEKHFAPRLCKGKKPIPWSSANANRDPETVDTGGTRQILMRARDSRVAPIDGRGRIVPKIDTFPPPAYNTKRFTKVKSLFTLMSRVLFLCAVFVSLACAHGVPTPAAIGPLHVEGSAIKDSTGQFIPIRGAQLQTVAAMNDVTFGIMRLHWNFNAVRLPVSSAIWRSDGQKYLDQVGSIVKAANGRGLIAVLADFEDSSLPGPDSVTF
jgi:hypothetical protein